MTADFNGTAKQQKKSKNFFSSQKEDREEMMKKERDESNFAEKLPKQREAMKAKEWIRKKRSY
jgi:hypothetical protein